MIKSNECQYLISFIIIEYHSVGDILKCVKSIDDKCSHLKHEIIVSSNSMYDKEKQTALLNKYPDLKWVFNEKNGGFAYGMNRGIEVSSGEYIIIQNPDTRILKGDIYEILQNFSKEDTIGIIGPKIINDKGEVQDSCRKFLLPSDIIKRLSKRIINRQNVILEKAIDYGIVQDVNWIIGAFMIIPRKKLYEVGLLNEKFFMYVEDMDLCLRFWEKNYRVVYNPNLVIEYEGDRKSTLKKSKFLPFSINKYTKIHVKNYFMFISEHGIAKLKYYRKLLD